MTEGTDSFNFEHETATTVDVSVGGEYFIADDAALRAGVYSDSDVSPELVDGEPVRRIDWWNFTLGLGLKDEALETSYGLGYRYGSGVEASPNDFGPADADGLTETVAVPFRAHGVMLMVSGDIRAEPEDVARSNDQPRQQSAP